MKTVAFITTPLKSGHAIRGVGFYTKRLLANLVKLAPEYDLTVTQDPMLADLVHYPYFDLFLPTLSVSPPVKTVVTIHDVTPLEFPDHYPPGIMGKINLARQKSALAKVNRVITDSHASIQAIHRILGVPHEKLRLIYLAADDIYRPIKTKSVLAKVKSKYHLPDKFILYVGDVGWNKNISTLLKAAKTLDYPVVLVGKSALALEQMDTSHPELRHIAELKAQMNDSVLRVGFVPDEDLAAIYNLATVYCQPSIAEGFGLPVLEALASGCPVASSSTSSLPEIGGQAVEYFDPYDTEDMVRALKAAKDKGGVAQAKKFSWEKTARETLQVYTEIL